MCLDQEAVETSAYESGLHHGMPHSHRHTMGGIHTMSGGHQPVPHNHPTVMYGTIRPNQRQSSLNSAGTICLGPVTDASFHDFVPPPPPMFENGGGAQCISTTPQTSEHKKLPKNSSKQGGSRPVVAPKPKVDGKGTDKAKEKKKRESTV